MATTPSQARSHTRNETGSAVPRSGPPIRGVAGASDFPTACRTGCLWSISPLSTAIYPMDDEGHLTCGTRPAFSGASSPQGLFRAGFPSHKVSWTTQASEARQSHLSKGCACLLGPNICTWMRNEKDIWVIGSFVVIVLVATAFFLCHFWPHGPEVHKEPPSTFIRNSTFMAGGIIAIALGVWRSIVAQRQVENLHRQLEAAREDRRLSEQRNLNGRFQDAVTMLGHDHLIVRMGGIHALYELARSHPSFKDPTVEILYTFKTIGDSASDLGGAHHNTTTGGTQYHGTSDGALAVELAERLSK